MERFTVINKGLLTASYGVQRANLSEKSLQKITMNTNGEIVLTNNNTINNTRLSWVLKRPNGSLFRLIGAFSLSEVAQGEKRWHRAAMFLSGRSDEGKWRGIEGSRLLFETGTKDLISNSAIIEIPIQYDEIRVLIQLAKTTGRLTVHGLSLDGITETAFSIFAQSVLFLAWVIGLLICISFLLQSKISKLAMVLVIAVGALLLMPGKHKSVMDIEVLKYLDQVVGEQGQVKNQNTINSQATQKVKSDPLKPLMKKLLAAGVKLEHLVHLLLFGLLTFVLLITGETKKEKRYEYIYYLLLYAAITEILQYFSPGRNPGLLDVVINAAGVILGATGYYIQQRLENVLRSLNGKTTAA